MTPKITIAIPAYNSAKTIRETLANCLLQEYPLKEILVIDDGSTDRTVNIVRIYAKINPEIRLIVNDWNIGIGKNLERLMEEARGKYVVYMCADDLFANTKVLGDIVNQFDNGDHAVGVIGRYFYFFRDGYPGAISVSREKRILIQSCCPSGMAFRKDVDIIGTNKIFIEMPYIVSQYLRRWRWTMFEYDTVAARFHPGGNTGTKKEYYKESPTQNWINLVGKEFKSYETFVMLKNRAPSLLWNEIKIVVNNNKNCLKEWDFWAYALIAIIIPGCLLRPLTNFYRHRIARRWAKIIERPA